MFESVDVPAGPAAYAERFLADSFLKMPANAAVNMGYLLVGGLWLYRAFRSPIRERQDQALFVAFAALAILYGPVQLIRIVTQHRAAGIADQWLTLPFFALVVAWNAQVQGRSWARAATLPLLGLSLASYLLADLHPRGFEWVLAIHIAVVLGFSVVTLRQTGKKAALPFVLAVVCCAAFVGLKLFDFPLRDLGLTRFTGHFWSKVADFLQIHFAAQFFLKATPRPVPVGSPVGSLDGEWGASPSRQVFSVPSRGTRRAATSGRIRSTPAPPRR